MRLPIGDEPKARGNVPVSGSPTTDAARSSFISVAFSGRRSIRLRVLAYFLGLLTALLSTPTYLIWQQHRITQSLTLVTKGYLPLATVVARLDHDRERVENDIDRLSRGGTRPKSGGRSTAEVYISGMTSTLEQAAAHVGRARVFVLEPEDQAYFNKIETQLGLIDRSFDQWRARALAYIERGPSMEGSNDLHAELTRDATRIGDEIDTLRRLVDGRVDQLTRSTEAEQSRTTAVAILLTSIATTFGVILVFAVRRSLAPIAQLTTEVQRFALGDYARRVEVTGDDEVSVLASEFNAMAEAVQVRDLALLAKARSDRLAAIGQMLAQITHEVRNPLNALSLNAELLADEVDSLDPERRTEAWDILRTVSSEIDRLTQVTGYYLQLARRPQTQRAPEDLAGLCQEIVRLTAAELAQRGATLTTEFQDLPHQWVDANQLKQALLNVLRNALEAGARHLHLRLGRAEGDIRLSLQDDGEGMNPENLDKVSEPFFSTKASGTGLGLAITKQILDDHEGSLRILSSPGQGTTVEFLLPDRPDSDLPQRAMNRRNEHV